MPIRDKIQQINSIFDSLAVIIFTERAEMALLKTRAYTEIIKWAQGLVANQLLLDFFHRNVAIPFYVEARLAKREQMVLPLLKQLLLIVKELTKEPEESKRAFLKERERVLKFPPRTPRR